MMTPATTLAMIMLAGPPDAFAAHAGDQVATFQAGLDLAEVDWDDFRFDEDVVAVWGGDKWRVPLFTLFFNDPWKASPYGREHAGAARAAAPSLHDLLYLSQANTGIRVRNNYYASFLTEASAQVEADGDLALARALANDPEILLADEPTGNLDAETGQEILDLLKREHEAGLGIMMVTHDRSIAALADRTVVLQQGQVVPDESPVSH